MVLLSMKICQTWTFLLKTDQQRKFVKERYKISLHTFHSVCVCFFGSEIAKAFIYVYTNAVQKINITPHKVTQFNNFQILNTNLLLTEREGHNNEYWPEVVPVRTERCEVRTKTTEGQYSPVQIKLLRLIRSLFHGTPWRETVCSEKSQPRRPESIRTLTFTSRLSCHKHTCNIHHYIVQYPYLLLFLFCRCWRHTKRSMNITGWNRNTDRVYTRGWWVKWHSQGTTGR